MAVFIGATRTPQIIYQELYYGHEFSARDKSGNLFKRRYLGYSKKEALKKFKREVLES